MRKLLTVLAIALAIGAVYLANAVSYAQDEGVKAIAEEELIPAKEPLILKYLPVAPSPAKVSVETCLALAKEASTLNVPLYIQDKAFPGGGGSISSVSIRAFHDGAYIYFLLEWTDVTKDDTVLTGTSFRDSVALMFPVGKYAVIDVEHPFSPRMGDRDKPVNLWHWKADWERDLQAPGGLVDSGSVYPARHDDYMSDKYHLAIRDNLLGTVKCVSGGLAADNILSQPHKESVEDLNAVGFGTLTSQAHQDVKGNGVWKDGSWHVLITRPLTTADTSDVQFIPGDDTVFNVAVWNGSEGDKDGQKSISLSWHPVKLEAVSYE